MALVDTGPDALRFFHTGASNHGDAQTDPDASIGTHLSSTEAAALTATDTTPSLGSCPITIDRVAGRNGTGNGTLTATGVDTVTWTPPGGSAGPAVTILNGETRQIPGNDADKYLVMTRDAATSMTSSTVVAVIYNKPNVFGFDDISVAEQAAGDDEYRCVGIENLGSADVKNIKVRVAQLGTQQVSDGGQLGASGAGSITTTGSFSTWPASGGCWISTSADAEREFVYYSSRTATVLTVPAAGRGLGVTSAAAGAATDKVYAVPLLELALDAPASQPSGTFEVVADEDTAPTGPTFTTPVIAADELSIGDLTQNQIYGIWMHRITPAGAASQADMLNSIEITADAA
jgi:hypothetical protein